MEREEIADAVGYSERTLLTYFLPELYEVRRSSRSRPAISDLAGLAR